MATFDFYPFDAGDGAEITEDRWTNMFTWMRTVGVLSEDSTLAPDSELAVNPADPSVGTQVQVEDGEAFIQGFMFMQTDGPEVLDITLNDSGDPRIDLVVLRLDKPNDVISYVVIEGTPDPSPVPPDPIQNSTIWDLPLAQIAVADGAVVINSGDITDERVRSVQGDGGSSAVTLTSAGGTETLVNDGVGPDLATKGLTAGANITLTGSGTDITIAATGAGSSVTLSNAGTTSLVNDGVGPTLATKGLVAGTGVSFSTSSTDVTITNSDPASGVTLTSAGGTQTLVNDGTGPSLATKGLTAGTGISLGSTSTAVTITNSDTGSAVTLANAGTTSLVNDGVGPALATKGLVAGSNMSFSTTSTDITITNSNAPNNSPVCGLNRTSDISVPNNTVTYITWSSGYDPLSMWDGNQSITIPQTGFYLLQLRFSYITPALANGYLYAVIINSTTSAILASWTVLGAASTTYSLNASVSTQITSTQVIKAYAFQTSGQTCTVDATLGLIQPRISVIKLRE